MYLIWKIWKKTIASLTDYQIITYHAVWSYLFDAFNLNCLGTIEKLPGIPPTAKHLHQLKQKINSQKPTLIITASYYPQLKSKRFAEEINAKHVTLAANVMDPKIPSYVQLFDYMIDSITP